MSQKIWQPTHPTLGWIQAEMDSDLTIHLPHPDGDVPMFFRRIPAGEFRLGSRGNGPREEPVHRVVIPHDFYLGTFPVTQAQYRAIAGACGLDPEPSHFKDRADSAHRPVEQVSWDDAIALCRKLSNVEFFNEALAKKGLDPVEWAACLPSEAMWEYASRAGAETDYWNGDGEAALAEVGWYEENSDNETHPVGELPANHWGLHDMHGNVFDLCADAFDQQALRRHPDGWEIVARLDYLELEWQSDALVDRALIAVRGGCFVRGFGAWSCLSACRATVKRGGRGRNIGFRICLLPGPEKSREAETVGQWRDGIGITGNADLGEASFPLRSGGEHF